METREWYDDGFTMEEQREFKRNAIQLKVTDKFKADAADKLIKQLRQKIGENESYIEELEDVQKKLLNKIEVLKEINKKFADRYSADVSEVLKEPIFAKITQENKDLKKRINDLEAIRDNLIYKLNKQ